MVVDALTYAGHYPTIAADIKNHSHLTFYQMDIRDKTKVDALFDQFNFSGVIHFAAESHVDRSIHNPNIFVETNVLGTLNLLNAAKKIYQKKLPMRFMQISTDEVYGHLHAHDPAFTENHPLAPRSPYSASKASADFLVLSYFHTFGLPVVISRCSNNYGPYQFPEKLIPLMIQRAQNNQPLPVYGKGENIRDWIHVNDHNDGVWIIYQQGQAGEVYNLGGDSEMSNIQVVKKILHQLNRSEDLISYVTDRLGHDFRYAMDFSKMTKEFSWRPKMSFEQGLAETVIWYQHHQDWVKSLNVLGKEG